MSTAKEDRTASYLDMSIEYNFSGDYSRLQEEQRANAAAAMTQQAIDESIVYESNIQQAQRINAATAFIAERDIRTSDNRVNSSNFFDVSL